MIDFLLQVLWETWTILKEASVFLLFGFVLAGILAVLVPAKFLSKLFGGGKVKSVLWASAIGAPLPLCSCGVLPTALAMKRQGATPGATVAFLIATPETGVDSISLSYALMDPIITVARPIAGVVTAIAAGLATNFMGEKKTGPEPTDDAPRSIDMDESQQQGQQELGIAHSHEHSHGLESGENGNSSLPGVRRTLGRIYQFAFRQLLDETSYWLILGIVLSGIVATALPVAFLEQYLGGEFVSMLAMLLIGIPIYTCASSSTPLAAALVMKGLNPGAALVFLLAGPATNLGSLVVLLKFLGARVMAIYLSTIFVMTLAAGYALNSVYRTWDINPRATFGAATGYFPESVKVAGALALIALLLLSMRRTHIPNEWIWLRDRFALLTGLRLTAPRLTLAAWAVIVALYCGSGLFQIQLGEVGLLTRFGAIVPPELGPGLHYRLPWPLETQRIIQKDRVQRIEFGMQGNQSAQVRASGRERLSPGGFSVPESLTRDGTWFQKEVAAEEPFLLTGDGNLIDLRWTVQYRVKDAVAFEFNVAEPETILRSVSLAELRGVVARSGIDAIYTSDRSGIERQVERALQETLDQVKAGVEVLSFHLLYVHPPEEVHDAFRDVASAQEDKLRTVNRANIFAVESVNQAKGEAAAMIEQALAFKEQQILHAQGDAASFLLRLGAYRRAPELTKFRLQIETIEQTLPGLQKFVRPGAGDIKDFDIWLLQPVGVSRSK